MAPIRLAVLLSGSGTTLQNLVDRIADARLAAQIVQVVSSKSSAFGLERARIQVGLLVLVHNGLELLKARRRGTGQGLESRQAG